VRGKTTITSKGNKKLTDDKKRETTQNWEMLGLTLTIFDRKIHVF